MASDHLIKETNKFLERIAKAAERTATALEKMVVEDDEDLEIEEAKENEEDELERAKAVIREAFGDYVYNDIGIVDIKLKDGQLSIFFDHYSNVLEKITKHEASMILMKSGVKEVFFIRPVLGTAEVSKRCFREFEGWVGA